MTTPSQWLAELPAPIQVVVFGAEVPTADTESGERVGAAFEQAAAGLARAAERLDAEIAALPDCVREELHDQIAGAARQLSEATAGSGEFCRRLAESTGQFNADTVKEVASMVAFGLMTVYQILVAGGWHPIRAFQLLSQARAKHLARWAEFVGRRAGQGAAAAAERAALSAIQVGGFAVFAGGVDAGIQAWQVAQGSRDRMDWKSVEVATVAGAGAAVGGALGAGMAGSVLSRVQRLPPGRSSLLVGGSVVAVAGGLGGAVGGALGGYAMTDQFSLTWAEVGSNVLLGIAEAAAHIRGHTVVSANREVGPLPSIPGPNGISPLMASDPLRHFDSEATLGIESDPALATESVSEESSSKENTENIGPTEAADPRTGAVEATSGRPMSTAPVEVSVSAKDTGAKGAATSGSTAVSASGVVDPGRVTVTERTASVGGGTERRGPAAETFEPVLRKRWVPGVAGERGHWVAEPGPTEPADVTVRPGPEAAAHEPPLVLEQVSDGPDGWAVATVEQAKEPPRVVEVVPDEPGHSRVRELGSAEPSRFEADEKAAWSSSEPESDAPMVVDLHPVPGTDHWAAGGVVAELGASEFEGAVRTQEQEQLTPTQQRLQDAAQDILDDYHARSDSSVPEESRPENISESALRDMLLNGTEHESLLAAIETVRRRTGKLLYREQLMGVLAMREGLVPEMVPGSGKTLTAAVHNVWSAIHRGPALLVTSSDPLAYEAFAESSAIFGDSGVTFVRIDPDRPVPLPENGRPTVYITTQDALGFAELRGNLGELTFTVGTIDEIDAALFYMNPLYVLSDGAVAPADAEMRQAVVAARDFVDEKLASGALTEADFGRDPTRPRSPARLTDEGLEKARRLWDGRLSDDDVKRINAAAAVALGDFVEGDHFVMHDGRPVIIDQVSHKVMRDPRTALESRWHDIAPAIEAAMIKKYESLGLRHDFVVHGNSDTATSVTLREVLQRRVESLTGTSGTVRNVADVLSQVYGTGEAVAIPRTKEHRLEYGGAIVAEDQQGKLINLVENLVRIHRDENLPQLVPAQRNSDVDRIHTELSKQLPDASIRVVDAKWILEQGVDWEDRLHEIVESAGEPGTITIINMQGARGNDYKVTDAISRAGGIVAHLYGRSPLSEDVDIQARNRVARNGQRGRVHEYLAFDDAVFDRPDHPLAQLVITRYRDAEAAYRAEPGDDHRAALDRAEDDIVELVDILQEEALRSRKSAFLRAANVVDASDDADTSTPAEIGADPVSELFGAHWLPRAAISNAAQVDDPVSDIGETTDIAAPSVPVTTAAAVPVEPVESPRATSDERTPASGALRPEPIVPIDLAPDPVDGRTRVPETPGAISQRSRPGKHSESDMVAAIGNDMTDIRENRTASYGTEPALDESNALPRENAELFEADAAARTSVGRAASRHGFARERIGYLLGPFSADYHSVVVPLVESVRTGDVREVIGSRLSDEPHSAQRGEARSGPNDDVNDPPPRLPEVERRRVAVGRRSSPDEYRDDIVVRYVTGPELSDLASSLVDLHPDGDPDRLGLDSWAEPESRWAAAVAELGGPGGRLVGFCLGQRKQEFDGTYAGMQTSPDSENREISHVRFEEPNVHITAMVVDRSARGFDTADAMLNEFLLNRSESLVSMQVDANDRIAIEVAERVVGPGFHPWGHELGADNLLYQGPRSTSRLLERRLRMDGLVPARSDARQGEESKRTNPNIGRVRALLRHIPGARGCYSALATDFFPDLTDASPRIGVNLRSIRERARVGAEELAARLGLSVTELDGWETGWQGEGDGKTRKQVRLSQENVSWYLRGLASLLPASVAAQARMGAVARGGDGGEVGVALAALRIDAGLESGVIADRGGWAPGAVERVESGVTKSSAEEVETYLRALAPGAPRYPEGYRSVGEYLKYLRQRSGETLFEAATAVRTTLGAMDDQESGRVVPSLETVGTYLDRYSDGSVSIDECVEAFPELRAVASRRGGEAESVGSKSDRAERRQVAEKPVASVTTSSGSPKAVLLHGTAESTDAADLVWAIVAGADVFGGLDRRAGAILRRFPDWEEVTSAADRKDGVRSFAFRVFARRPDGSVDDGPDRMNGGEPDTGWEMEYEPDPTVVGRRRPKVTEVIVRLRRSTVAGDWVGEVAEVSTRRDPALWKAARWPQAAPDPERAQQLVGAGVGVAARALRLLDVTTVVAEHGPVDHGTTVLVRTVDGTEEIPLRNDNACRSVTVTFTDGTTAGFDIRVDPVHRRLVVSSPDGRSVWAEQIRVSGSASTPEIGSAVTMALTRALAQVVHRHRGFEKVTPTDPRYVRENGKLVATRAAVLDAVVLLAADELLAWKPRTDRQRRYFFDLRREVLRRLEFARGPRFLQRERLAALRAVSPRLEYPIRRHWGPFKIRKPMMLHFEAAPPLHVHYGLSLIASGSNILPAIIGDPGQTLRYSIGSATGSLYMALSRSQSYLHIRQAENADTAPRWFIYRNDGKDFFRVHVGGALVDATARVGGSLALIDAGVAINPALLAEIFGRRVARGILRGLRASRIQPMYAAPRDLVEQTLAVARREEVYDRYAELRAESLQWARQLRKYLDRPDAPDDGELNELARLLHHLSAAAQEAAEQIEQYGLGAAVLRTKASPVRSPSMSRILRVSWLEPVGSMAVGTLAGLVFGNPWIGLLGAGGVLWMFLRARLGAVGERYKGRERATRVQRNNAYREKQWNDGIRDALIRIAELLENLPELPDPLPDATRKPPGIFPYFWSGLVEAATEIPAAIAGFYIPGYGPTLAWGLFFARILSPIANALRQCGEEIYDELGAARREVIDDRIALHEGSDDPSEIKRGLTESLAGYMELVRSTKETFVSEHYPDFPGAVSPAAVYRELMKQGANKKSSGVVLRQFGQVVAEKDTPELFDAFAAEIAEGFGELAPEKRAGKVAEAFLYWHESRMAAIGKLEMVDRYAAEYLPLELRLAGLFPEEKRTLLNPEYYEFARVVAELPIVAATPDSHEIEDHTGRFFAVLMLAAARNGVYATDHDDTGMSRLDTVSLGTLLTVGAKLMERDFVRLAHGTSSDDLLTDTVPLRVGESIDARQGASVAAEGAAGIGAYSLRLEGVEERTASRKKLRSARQILRIALGDKFFREAYIDRLVRWLADTQEPMVEDGGRVFGGSDPIAVWRVDPATGTGPNEGFTHVAKNGPTDNGPESVTRPIPVVKPVGDGREYPLERLLSFYADGVDPVLRSELLRAMVKRAAVGVRIADSNGGSDNGAHRRWEAEVARLEEEIDRVRSGHDPTVPLNEGITALRVVNDLAGRDIVSEIGEPGSISMSAQELQANTAGRVVMQPSHVALAARLANPQDRVSSALVVDREGDRPYVLTVCDGVVVKIDPHSGPPHVFVPTTETESPYAVLFDSDFDVLHPLDAGAHVRPHTENRYSESLGRRFRGVYSTDITLGIVSERIAAVAAEEGVDSVVSDDRSLWAQASDELRRLLQRRELLERKSAALHTLAGEHKRAVLEYFYCTNEYERLTALRRSVPEVASRLPEIVERRKRAADEYVRLGKLLDTKLDEHLPGQVFIHPSETNDYCAPAAVMDMHQLTGNDGIRFIGRDVSGFGVPTFEIAAALGAYPTDYGDHLEMADDLVSLGHGATILVDEEGHVYVLTNYRGLILVSDWNGTLLHLFPPEGREVVENLEGYVFAPTAQGGIEPLRPMDETVRDVLMELASRYARIERSQVGLEETREALKKVRSHDPALVADLTEIERRLKDARSVIRQLEDVGYAMVYEDLPVVDPDHLEVIPDGSLDAVSLRTVRYERLLDSSDALWGELFRILKAGGAATIDTDVELFRSDGVPREVVDRLTQAGFADIAFLYNDESFTLDAVPMGSDGRYTVRVIKPDDVAGESDGHSVRRSASPAETTKSHRDARSGTRAHRTPWGDRPVTNRVDADRAEIVEADDEAWEVYLEGEESVLPPEWYERFEEEPPTHPLAGSGPIRGAHFPVPELRMTTNDPEKIAALGEFSLWQAEIANTGLYRLSERWDSTDEPVEGHVLLSQLYCWISHQRYLRQVWAIDHDPAVARTEYDHPEAFRTLLDDYDHINIDIFGNVHARREGFRSDPDLAKRSLGAVTPAYRTSQAIGEIIRTRVEAEAPDGDELQNIVELPDGSRVGGTVLSCLTPVRQTVETALSENREAMFAAAMTELADMFGHRPPDVSGDLSRRAANVAYLLFQAPLTTRGSDATIRTFLVATFTFLFGRPIRLPHDIDVRGISMRQTDFVEWFTDMLDRESRAHEPGSSAIPRTRDVGGSSSENRAVTQSVIGSGPPGATPWSSRGGGAHRTVDAHPRGETTEPAARRTDGEAVSASELASDSSAVRPGRSAAVIGPADNGKGVESRSSRDEHRPEHDVMIGPEAFGGLGALLWEHGVVVGAAAVSLTLEGTFGTGLVELSVPEWVYRRMAEHPEWVELPPDSDEGQRMVGGYPADHLPRRGAGRPSLGWGRFRISVGWPGLVPVRYRERTGPDGQRRDPISHEELRERAWRAEDGMRVAGLPDVYAWAQERDLPADVELAQTIKDALLHPTRSRFPARVLEDESAEIIDILRTQSRIVGKPFTEEALAGDPRIRRAVALIAEGVYTARTLYGDPRIGRANHLYGSFELREYQVGAFYHNGDLAEGLRAIVRNGLFQNGGPEDILHAMCAAAWSDAVYGHGRRSDNPGGHDERRSAELLAARARLYGFDETVVAEMVRAVEATTFVETTKRQAAAFTDDLRQQQAAVAAGERRGIGQWNAGEDLHNLSSPEMVVDAIGLAVEDLMSKRAGEQRIFGRILARLGIRANYLPEALRLIDVYGAMRSGAPDGDGMTVRTAFAAHLRGSAVFVDPDAAGGHRYPDGWLLGNRDMRRDHAVLLRRLVHRLETDPDFSPLDAFYEACEHADHMREKYSGFRWQLVIRPGAQPWNPIAVTEALRRRLPGGDGQGVTRDVIDGVLRVMELVAPDAVDAQPAPNGKADAAIVLTMTEDTNGHPRLRAQLDYSVLGAPPNRTALHRALAGVDCRISVEEQQPLWMTEQFPRCRVLLDFAHPVVDDERDRTGFTDPVTESVSVPITIDADAGTVTRRARSLLEAVSDRREHLERFALLVEALMVRCGVMDIEIRIHRSDDGAVVDMRAGSWGLDLEIGEEPATTAVRVRFPVAPEPGGSGRSDDLREILAALLPDAPLFAAMLTAEVTTIGSGELTIAVTGVPGHRTVEFVLDGARPARITRIEPASTVLEPSPVTAVDVRDTDPTITEDTPHDNLSFTIHICTKDGPERLSALLSDIASVAPTVDTVFVYDDSVNWVSRVRNRSALQSMSFRTVHIDESARRELLRDMPWPSPEAKSYAAYAFKELGKPKWDYAGVRALVHFIAASASPVESKLLFLDDDLRLIDGSFGGERYRVDSEAIARLLAEPISSDGVVGAEFVGRPDVYDVEYARSAMKLGYRDAGRGGNNRFALDYEDIEREETWASKVSIGGGFLLLSGNGARQAPIPHHYNEDCVFITVLEAYGYHVKAAPFKPLHAGGRRGLEWRMSLDQQVGAIVQKSLEKALEEVGIEDLPTLADRAIGHCEDHARASTGIWKELFADPDRQIDEIHAHNVYALMDYERLAREAQTVIATYFRQWFGWRTLMEDAAVSNHVRRFIARVSTPSVFDISSAEPRGKHD
ncbi:hypothetical protein [Nocardia paucivorans]|uniref:hypothetical protein n=1 Tax=Nocardia paucivorans TaxID=114259 RepID=UPI0002F0AC8C|nr:hypothetical protein [Nocardia paucivorans]